jgi:hypothetical protein
LSKPVKPPPGATGNGGLKIIRRSLFLTDQVRLFGIEPKVLFEAFGTGNRQFHQAILHGFKEGRIGAEYREVRLGEVAVILGVFLGPHGHGLVPVLIPEPGLLDHGLPRVQHLPLPGNLVVEPQPHKPG